MKCLKKAYSKYRSWKQRDFLKWRDELSEYEKDFLLPELKGRCEELLKYCKEINNYCDNRVDEKAFGTTLRSLMLDSQIEHLIPVALRPPTAEVLARKFFTEIKNMNQITFIEPLESVIQKIKPETNLKEFGTILNEINHVCSTVIQVKEKLFLYSLASFTVVLDRQTNQPVMTEPKELKVLLVPFQNTIENIYGVANSTSETIHQWHKEQMNWKTEFLKVISQRIAQRNNLLAILVAIAVSWAFLTATQPLEKYQLGKENESLKQQIVETQQEKQLFEKQIKLLNLKVEELNKTILETKMTHSKDKK